MAYSTNPNLPKARAIALKLLIIEELPACVVARKCGIHRSTVWRWKKKWSELNNGRTSMKNEGHPSQAVGKINHASHYRWMIVTDSSCPLTNPKTICKSIVRRILELRATLKRCAEVIWHHVTVLEGIKVSLSSVRRILRRHHCYDGSRKKRVRSDNPKRPLPTNPGELIQIDTIHHRDPFSDRKLYYYTVIDLYSRMTHVIMSTSLRQGKAVQAILEAQAKWSIPISMAQADNGPEFGNYFRQQLLRRGIAVRHSRLGRPNDNAHIERFNRTLQEECIGHHCRSSVSLRKQQVALTEYVDFYNEDRVHLGLQCRVPKSMLQRS